MSKTTKIKKIGWAFEGGLFWACLMCSNLVWEKLDFNFGRNVILMKKSFLFLSCFLFAHVLFCADLSAKFVTVEAAKKDTVEESIDYLSKQVKQIDNPAEKRAVYVFLASLQEQLSLFDDAQKSYAQAAAISAGDAQGMPKKSNEQIVLDAVRCALSAGDYVTADSYLNSAVRNSKNEDIQAMIKLYSQWSELCKADSTEDLVEPILMLEAYSKMDSMKSVKAAVLLTLWYITGEKLYENQILSAFPDSVEAGIVKGDVQLLPTPFWFFVPKTGEAVQGTGTFPSSDYSDSVQANEKSASAKTISTAKSSNQKDSVKSSDQSDENNVKFSKWQLGLFRTESNAKLLMEEVCAKGFDAYITSEKRASGTTYYIVLVREDKNGNVAERLRSAGYDCYAVE